LYQIAFWALAALALSRPGLAAEGPDALYAQRATLSKAVEAAAIWQAALDRNPSDFDAAWKRARAGYWIGGHETTQAARDAAYEAAMAAARKAIAAHPDKPEGHFWLGANYGGNAEISMLASLTDIEDIKREMEAVIKIDEGFEAGSAYLALGQVYMKAPKIFGGDVQKAIDYFQKGLKVGENNGLLHLRLAEAYAEEHRNEDARQQLKILFEKKATPGYEPEYNDAVKKGRELEEKLKQ